MCLFLRKNLYLCTFDYLTCIMNFPSGSIEFLTVAVEYCRFVESAEDFDDADFRSKMCKLLPLLYLKAFMVELPQHEDESDDEPERFIDELSYNSIRRAVQDLMGERDQYLTASHPDIDLSDTVVAASVSEDIADIYQSVGDFAYAAKQGDELIMVRALKVCINDFKAYWGARLLSTLYALHSIYASE